MSFLKSHLECYGIHQTSLAGVPERAITLQWVWQYLFTFIGRQDVQTRLEKNSLVIQAAKLYSVQDH